MSKFAIGKYKNILVSIGLFLILDASVLMLNFYISFQIAEDATSINLAGRQRMLSQRMTKSLLDLEYSYESEDSRARILKELELSRNLFDETFTAFDYGGDATGAGGNKVSLNKADDTKSRQAVDTAKNIWLDYMVEIDDVLNNKLSEGDVALQSAIAFGQRNNLTLLKLMNDLTVSLEQVAASKAQRLRLIQTAGIGMALINFFIILFHFVGQLRKGDEVLEEARKETTEILLTVNEGLFLIHENFSIGSQRSEKLYEILSIDSADDVNFESLLKDIVSYKDLEASQGFLRLLFNPKIKERLIGDLNPLEKIQVNISDGLGGYNTKYLSFDFKRVYNESVIVDVLATVNDITEKVLLEKQLKVAKENNEQQIEMLTSILHANPSLLKRFLDNAYTCFSTINNQLKQPAKTQVHFRDKINAIFIEIHNFKGESSALELTEFTAMAHDFEEDLAVMRDSKDIKGQDFLSLTVRLDKIISYAQSITSLVEKLSKFGRFTNSAPDELSKRRDSWEHLNTLVNELSGKYQKQVMLVSSGLNDVDVPNALRETVNSLCIQFIRNSMVHGIETPEERKATQKNPQGRIDIRLSSTPGGVLEMVFRDDGAGFNFNKLREKALALGKATAEEIEHWDNKRLLSLIFSPGFSTADVVNDDAGRGVGMDVVMQKIKQVKGRITISHKESQYTRFTVSFPMLSMNQVA
jgi:HPt (histidine-containing phosphotransfer) domain-containing protein